METETASHTDARAQRFYRPELDILRFFAFLLVFIDHAFPVDPQVYLNLHISPETAAWFSATVMAGGLGVDLFFALSAYLITELLIREHGRFGHLNLRGFYVRRALRIYPLYYGFLAVAIFLSRFFAVGGYLSTGYKLLFLLPLGNWACVLWGFPSSVVAHLWSVSIEEQFYFVYPLALRIFGISRIAILAAVMLGVANLTRLVAVMAGVTHPGVWCNTLARLDPIACGALAALWLRGGGTRLTPRQRVALSALGLFLLVASARFTQSWGTPCLIYYPVVAVGAMLILLSFLRQTPLIRNYFTNSLIYLGRISYGLYVWHLLSLSLAERLKFGERYAINLASKVVIGFVITIALSIASYELYESYFLKLKERFTLIPSRPV